MPAPPSYWGEFNRPGGIATRQADRVAAAAREDAAAYTPAQLIEPFSETGPQAIATARQLGSVVVDYFGRPCWRWTRRSASASWKPPSTCSTCSAPWSCRPDVPRASLEHTVGLLAAMTPAVDFIELATGRSQVAVFPVLR